MLSALLCSAVLFMVPMQDEPAAKVGVGSVVPDYEFAELLGGDGRLSMNDFRGHPVLIVNWTDSDFGRGAAEQLQKVAKELVPQGLVSILHDSHNKTRDDIEAAVLRRFPGNRSWLTRTRNLPFDYEDNGPPPDIALVGVDGTVLIAGSYTVDFGPAVKAVKTELKKRKSGWGEHKVARKARALAFGDGALQRAYAMLVSALSDEPDHEELGVALDDVTTAYLGRSGAVTHLLETGHPARAHEIARDLVRDVAGHKRWEPEATKLLKRFDEKAVKEEIERDEKLTSTLKPLAKSKPKATHVKKLRKLAEQWGDSPVGRRAAHLADMAERASG